MRNLKKKKTYSYYNKDRLSLSMGANLLKNEERVK